MHAYFHTVQGGGRRAARRPKLSLFVFFYLKNTNHNVPSTTRTMSIRLLTISDLPAIEGGVVEQTSRDNFHWYFFPRKWEYPFDYRHWWRSYLRASLLRPSCFVYGVESKDGSILGWAALETNGTPPPSFRLRQNRREGIPPTVQLVVYPPLSDPSSSTSCWMREI